MANFGQVAERIRTIDVGKIFVDFATRNDDAIIGLVRSQLYQGETGEGKVRPKYYGREDYAQEKHADNPRPGYGTPDLFYSGDFYNGMFLQEAKETHAKVWSTDDKTNMLILDGWQIYGKEGDYMHQPYGLEVFELNEESLQQLRPRFAESITENVRKTLNL